MFEQTFITYKDQQRTWTYMLGVAGELLAVGVLLLLPLIYTEKLTNFGFSHLPLTSPHSQPPKPPDMKAIPGRVATHHRFVAVLNSPTVIPSKPVMLADVVDAPSTDFVPGAVPGDNTGTALLSMRGDAAPPPPVPPKPVERQPVAVSKPKQEPVRLGGDVQAAKIIRRVMPVYPQLARAARVQGTVQLVGMIAKDGTIVKLQVISGHPLLIAAAVEAVRQWVYRPTLLNGEPVEVIAPIEVHFTLAQ
jgi:periplasmic protein TonB